MNSTALALKIRRHAIDMVYASHASHIASALSIVDMVAVLYTDILRVDPARPQWTDRDRLILSKGHAGVALSYPIG